VLRQLLNKLRGLFERVRKWNAHEEGPSGRVSYTSVPFWRPWRDF